MLKINTLLRLTLLISFSLLFTLQLAFAQSLYENEPNDKMPPLPRKFYKHDVIAVSGVSLQAVQEAPSINDNGVVAFGGRNNFGFGIFKSETPGAFTVAAQSAPGVPFAGTVQINNSNQIIARRTNSSSQPLVVMLRIEDNGQLPTEIAVVNPKSGIRDLNTLFTYPSINNNGLPTFSGIKNNSTVSSLVTGVRPNFNFLEFSAAVDFLRPMISDDGCVIARAGFLTTDPIRLYNYQLNSFETIASASNGFSALGRSSGLSDRCEVIVFYGNLTTDGAQMHQTNPGPGIFARIALSGGGSRIIRLAGRLVEDNDAPGGNNDGVCDPGETCRQGELGFTQAGQPLFFSEFEADSRVAVAHYALGAAGIEDDAFTVSFIATPNAAGDTPVRTFSNQKGLWTLTTRMTMDNGVPREKPAAAMPVVQVGDVISGRTVQTISVYDQIAKNTASPNSPLQNGGSHWVTFYANTNSGNMIVRSTLAETPVIFIPGIIGSVLEEDVNGTKIERWPGRNTGILLYQNLQRLNLTQNPNANIIATDVIRDFARPVGFSIIPVYRPLLEDTLSMQAGLNEYQVDGRPERRTYEGCDMAQAGSQPKLFVFAYDWRKPNAENADRLADYVRCIQRFYPGTKVDIVAHSMGDYWLDVIFWIIPIKSENS